MAHASVEIANEFLHLADGNLSQMQVQKLVYIAHGWNLAINGEPLVADTVRAWPYGPVYPQLYEHTKFFGSSPIGRLITEDDNELLRFFDEKSAKARAYKANLTDRERQVISHVWKRYGRLSAMKLSELTHQPNTPWFNAFKRGGQGTALPNDEIRRHYLDMAEKASNAAQ